MKELTDFEHDCLVALVVAYGDKHIVELVQSIAAQLAEDEVTES